MIGTKMPSQIAERLPYFKEPFQGVLEFKRQYNIISRIEEVLALIKIKI